nr:PREDICTED: fatty-acid amide hydrolase 2 [Opisthocomus hoazin]
MPNTSGLVNRRNVIATSDATVVSRLKQAGAIPLGVTNCSELCMWFESSNRVYGRTNTPYDLQRIVGGSSGGFLGAACSVIGVGSDIGGSIRMPAFFNGVFGHKPTTGVVPNDGQFPNARGVRTSFLCTGPMCRYAEDLEPMLRVMAGPGVNKLKLNEKVSLEKIKFHCMDHDGGSIFVSPVDKEILQAQKKVVEHLESELGVQVQHVAIHKMKYSFQIWSAMMSSKDSDGQEAQLFTELLGDHGNLVWPLWELMKWLVGMSSHTLPAIALGLTEKVMKLSPGVNAKLVSMGKSLREEMEALLGPDGVLLYPSHPTVAPRHHSPICMPFNFAYTAIFNVLGLPVTQCPLGLSSEGLPFASPCSLPELPWGFPHPLTEKGAGLSVLEAAVCSSRRCCFVGGWCWALPGAELAGTPLPPRDVRLEAQNFHVQLRWEPDPGLPDGAAYQVEWRRRTSHWTKADECWRNGTGSSWACELYFDKIHDIYWARVRAVAGGELSQWAYSSELQPYRDTIVGPPKLSWLLQGHTLSINVTMPLTPYRNKAGSYKPVDQVLLKLWYWLSLYEGDVLVQQVPCRRSREEAPCTFRYLKPSTQYCVRTAAADMAREQSREAEQCMVTPAGPAGFPWVLLAVLCGVLLLLTMAGLCFIQLHIIPGPSETHLPKTLALLNREMRVTVTVPTLELKEDSLALLLPTTLRSCGLPAAQQKPADQHCPA